MMTQQRHSLLRRTFRPRWTHPAIFFLDVFIRSLTRENEVEQSSQSSYVVAVSSSMCLALLDVPACYAGYRQPCIDQAPGANWWSWWWEGELCVRTLQPRERVWAGVCLPPYCQVCLYHHIYQPCVRNIWNKNRKSFFKHPRYNRYLLYRSNSDPLLWTDMIVQVKLRPIAMNRHDSTGQTQTHCYEQTW